MTTRIRYTPPSEEERLQFYAGAAPSENQQARLDRMKGWNAKRLAAAVPAWAKPNTGPAAFKPQLSMRFPAWTQGRTTMACTRVTGDFPTCAEKGTTAYVAAWNVRWGYRK